MCILHLICNNIRKDKVRNECILIKLGIAHIKEKMQENCYNV